ncbi:MAG: sensor histidine kinase [Clostridia bacterium]|nr:sensor histidine kinase [Clostridia bacterium]
MENWIVLSKLTLIIYCAIKFSSHTSNITPVILCILIFVIINMAYHVFKSSNLKTSLLIFSIISVMGCFFYVNPLFILLLPINIIELIYKHRENMWLTVTVLVAGAFTAGRGLVAEYVLISVFGFLIYVLSYNSHKKITYLTAETDSLKEKNHSLHDKLNKEAEYEKQLKYSSQLEERNKIAQEIHDKIGHSLSGSLMQLEAAKLLVEYSHIQENNNKVREILQSVINTLRDGMESIRATLRNIKPVSEQLGVNRLKLLLEEFTVNSKIKSNLLHKGNLEQISYVQWKIIYENIKEALTNTIKYSNASTVTVHIEVLNKFIKAEIRDNGVGAAKIKKGLGIAGMEERSEGIGGKIITDGSKGFSIITLLPIEGGKHADQIVNRG